MTDTNQTAGASATGETESYPIPSLVPEGFDTEQWDGDQYPYIPDESLSVAADLPLHTGGAEEVNPIDHEVIRYNLWNTALEHGQTIEKLAVSPITLETRDFQVTILTELGEPVFYGPYLQYFSGWSDLNVRYIMENRSLTPGIEEGDMFLSNDPWVGTGHQPDINLVAPVFWEGELFCWVVTSAHQSDVGGDVPGSFVQTAENIYDDPVPLPPFKIVQGGEVDPQMEELYRRHSRMPQHLSLDLRAAIAGNNHTIKNIKELLRKHGPETVKGSMREIIRTGEEAFVDKLSGLPDGRWRERVFMERAHPDDDGTYRVELEMEKDGTDLVFRNAGTAEQSGCLNLPFGGWRGGCATPFSVLLLPELMGAVGGVLRHLKFEPTPGTITTPTYGAAVSPAGTYGGEMAIGMAQSVLDKMLLVSDEEELKERVVTPTHMHWMFNVISGENADGEFFIGPMLDGVLGSTGATPYRDGRSGDGWIGCPTAQGPNVEFYERNWPVLYLYRRKEPDSAGAGEWKGGSGGIIGYTPHKGDVNLDTATVYAVPKTYGLLGGNPGTACSTRIARGSDIEDRLSGDELPVSIDSLGSDIERIKDKHQSTPVADEDVVEWRWCSTGGYGDPLRRSPDLVSQDVEEHLVTEESAEDIYGVVLDGEGADPEATAERREAIRADREARATVEDHDGPESVDAPESHRIGEYISIRDGHATCADCGQNFGPVDENFMTGMAIEETDIAEAGPSFEDPGWHVDDDDIRLYRFYCQGCQTLLSVTVGRTDEPVLDQFELLE